MKKHYFLFALAVFACVLILSLWSRREQPLGDLLSGEGTPEYSANGYYDGMEAQITGAIPQDTVSDLLDAAAVRKGKASNEMPSPCFEITVVFTNETYRVVIGADQTVSVAPISDLDSRTFWIDVSGELFDQLYRIHLENGGQEFPQ